MKKITKLSKSDIIKVKTAIKNTVDSQKKIRNRVAYIVKCIINEFKCPDEDFWALENYLFDPQTSDLSELFSNDKFIDIYYGLYADDEYGLYIFEKNTKPSDKGLVDLRDSFPRRWLFEDFEDELKSGRIKHRNWCDKIRQDKEAKIEKEHNDFVQKKDKSVASIKNKLTDAEWLKIQKYFKN